MAVIMRVRTVLSGWQGAPGLSTYYFTPGTTGGVTADATDAVARVRAAWQGSIGLFTTSFTAQVQTNVDLIENTTGALVGSLVGGPAGLVTGTNGASFESIATMALLQLTTGTILRGRRLRGRLFLGPVATPNVTGNGQLLGATGTAVAASWATTLTGSTATAPIIWARPVPTPIPPSTRPGPFPGSLGLVTGWSMPATLSVLRSRRD